MDSTAKAYVSGSPQAQDFFSQLQCEFASETVKECSQSSSGFVDDYLVDPEEANTPRSKQSNDAPVSKETDSGNSLVSTDHATLENNSIQVEEDQTCQTISTSFHGGHGFEQQDQPNAYENYNEDFGVVSDGQVENTILSWKKTYFRRSLQFGEAYGDNTGLKRSASESGHVVNLPHSMATSSPSQYEKFCAVSNSGAHLNSIVNPPSIGFSANASKTLAYQGVQGINSPSMMNNTKSYQGVQGINSPSMMNNTRSYQGVQGINSPSIMNTNYQGVQGINSPSMMNNTKSYQGVQGINSPSIMNTNNQGVQGINSPSMMNNTKSYQGVQGINSPSIMNTNYQGVQGINSPSIMNKNTKSYQGVQGINSPSMMNTKSYPVEKDSIRSEQGMDARKALVIGSSADNKRRKTESNGNGNSSGRKCCNCRKSKCLKLYCGCFHARGYCSSSCSCQGCFNKPEYEEKVCESRKKAMTHNPNAFAPKIAVEDSPNSQEDGNRVTPPSARHRSGCNCKKSMCNKKYCECYQASVGCSNKCRCEGCKNGYGKKEEFDGMKHGAMGNKVVQEIIVRTIGNQETLATKRDLPSSSAPPIFMPTAPSFQYSDHIKDVPNSRIQETAYPMSMKMLTSTQTIEDFNVFQHHLTPPDAQVPFHGSNNLWPPPIPFAQVQPYNGRNQLQSVAPPSGSCWPRSNQLSSVVDKSFDYLLQDQTTLEKKSPNKNRVSSQIYELSSSSFMEELRSSSNFNLQYPPAFPPLNRHQN